jgi:hypothetical protein
VVVAERDKLNQDGEEEEPFENLDSHALEDSAVPQRCDFRSRG